MRVILQSIGGESRAFTHLSGHFRYQQEPSLSPVIRGLFPMITRLACSRIFVSIKCKLSCVLYLHRGSWLTAR